MRPLLRLYAATAICVLLAFTRACGPECEFESRCDGNQRETCFVGVDQCIGAPARSKGDCAQIDANNPLCVDNGDDEAFCGGEPGCTQETCDGNVADTCNDGYHVRYDCTANGYECRVVNGQAACHGDF